MARESLQFAATTATITTDSSQSSSSDPSLSRNVSISRLNAQAPEFVPTRPSFRPDLQQQQQNIPPSDTEAEVQSALLQPRILIPPPPPPPPIGLIHVFPPPNPGSPYHVPIRNHVVPFHHHQHHLRHPSPHYHQQRHHSHHAPVQHHHHHTHQNQYYGSGVGGGGYGEQEGRNVQQAQVETDNGGSSNKNNKLSDETAQKLLNQVEYYFSDLNLATTDHLIRFINKDPEGYVPISVVASFKKIKAPISNHSQLAEVLRNSSKLVVSDDGKKVRRQQPLTESDMEELQSRIVVAENLPDDHCHQKLMKVFSTVGSVKTIRTCQPQSSNDRSSSTSRSAKGDSMPFSNKLHAFVEYESAALAEKAVVELNDEGNWRSGLRVRLMLKRTSKPAHARGKKGRDGEVNCEEDDTLDHQQNEKQAEDSSQQFDAHSHELGGEEHGNDKDGGQRKGRSRGRGRSQQYHHHNNRQNHVGAPSPSSNSVTVEQPGVAKQQPPGPRMPDGTRGFSMGRGKPVAVNIAQ